MSVYIKNRLKNFAPYTPGEQPGDMNFIKLNTNESPYPPGEKVLNAIETEGLKNLKLYPDPEMNELKEKLACVFALKKENYFVSNGSDDIINFAFMAYGGEGRKIYFPDVSYGFYKVFADFQGTDRIEVPVKEDLSIDYRDYLKLNDDKNEDAPGRCDIESGKGLIAIANPNAPTGLAISLSAIKGIALANPNKVILVDEAYVDFGGESAVSLIGICDNILVSRTFSKSYSLAGSRLGFAIGSENLIKDLELVKYSTNPYSVNRLTERVGLAALDENEYYIDNCKRIITTREKYKEELLEIGLKVTDSVANFIFAGVGDESPDDTWKKMSGENLYQALKDRGILVRWFNEKRINNYVRITVGREDEMEILVKAIREIKESVK